MLISIQPRYVTLIFLLIIISSIKLTVGDYDYNIKCIEIEKQALLSFKNGLLEDKHGMLSSWRNRINEDCCNWRGVKCSNLTRRVVELHLHGSNQQHLSGDIDPNSLLQLSHLTYLNFSNNRLSGPLPNFSSFLNLTLLDLSSNEFSGNIPFTLGQLFNLHTLLLNNNLVQGMILEPHFSKLTNLKLLDLSHNSLSFQMHSNWVPPFQLESIILSSCKLGPKFPQWLRGQNYSYLDLSNTSISDTIPHWFWNYFSSSLPSLDLSHNQIRGELPTLFIFLTRLAISRRSSVFIESNVNLRSNEFEGQIPEFLLQVRWVDVSNNKFSRLFNLCGLRTDSFRIYFLDASNNELSGELPNCWWNLPFLEVLRLANNALSGHIPSSFSNITRLRSLHLGNNNFSGKFPCSLKNLNDLQAVNLEGNYLTGAIPSWIGYKLTKLLRLSLRSNQFDGELPSSLCHLNDILILDLSLNSITGVIPGCLHNLTALVMPKSTNQGEIYIGSRGSTYTQGRPPIQAINDEMIVMWKGREFIMIKTLPLIRSIDLSGNHLIGKIPNEIAELVELVFLNLSRNSLRGGIPEKIGQLKSLDFLDLSRNELTGHIPSSLSRINRLSVLDLSFNKLSGKIPISTQLQSFNSSAYVGNLDLCGLPLPSCFGEEMVPDPPNKKNEVGDHENEFERQGFYISLAVGFIVGFWGICGTLMFHTSCRHAFFRFLNDLNDWLYVKMAIFRNEVRNLFSY